VDEDANGYIDWENFVQLYVRCRKDKSGREPTRMYNLIEFMVCDKDGGGTMSEDECMEILFHRFGACQQQLMCHTCLFFSMYVCNTCKNPNTSPGKTKLPRQTHLCGQYLCCSMRVHTLGRPV
jgi:hypothetical protein